MKRTPHSWEQYRQIYNSLDDIVTYDDLSKAIKEVFGELDFKKENYVVRVMSSSVTNYMLIRMQGKKYLRNIKEYSRYIEKEQQAEKVMFKNIKGNVYAIMLGSKRKDIYLCYNSELKIVYLKESSIRGKRGLDNKEARLFLQKLSNKLGKKLIQTKIM